MKFEFPDTGEGVTEGQFLEWKVEEGEQVEEDQIVGEAETDKAVVEIPSPSDGAVEELKASPGDTVKVGDVIMILDTGESDGNEKDINLDDSEEETSNSSEIESEKFTRENDEEASEEVLALPKVRKMAERNGVNLSDIKTGERITEDELKAFIGESGETHRKDVQETSVETGSMSDVSARPSVRKLARENGVDLSKVDGSGRGGEVTRSDVMKYTDNGDNQDLDNAEFETSDIDLETSESNERTVRRPLSGLEKSVGEKMSRSRFTAPHVTHVEKADVTELAELRNDLKNEVDPHLTFMPFIMKAVIPALKEYPELNSELDDEKDELLMKKFYCFNIAVDTDRGLLVPKVKNVDRKSLVDIAAELESTVDRTRNGNLNADEMSPGSFSISNIGAIGGEAFTPIINYPQTAILGVGKISESAEVVDGEVVPRMTVKLSLSYDHRVVDGATAARFMNTVVENLEDPEMLMLNL